jgi:hypothetical protein
MWHLDRTAYLGHVLGLGARMQGLGSVPAGYDLPFTRRIKGRSAISEANVIGSLEV